MVIQTNPFAYRQIDIQTLIPQNFRQIFRLLHGKKINPKSEKLRCIRLNGVPPNDTAATRAMRPGRGLHPVREGHCVCPSIHSIGYLAHFSLLNCNFFTLSDNMLFSLTWKAFEHCSGQTSLK